MHFIQQICSFSKGSPGDHNVEAWALEQIILFLCGRFITVTTWE